VDDANSRRRSIALLSTAALLMLAGFAAIDRSEQLNDGTGRLLRQQVVWAVFGSGCLIATISLGYRRWQHLGAAAYIATLVALVAVFVFPSVNGAQRWIRFGGVGVQPSEFAKPALIIALASFLSHRNIATGFWQLIRPLAITALPMILILREPDLGTSLVLLPILFAMLFAAGARRRDLVCLVAAGALLTPLLWSQMSREQKSRITALWEQNGPREKPTADGFHLDQAKRMFALGGVTGSFLTAESDDDLPACRVPEPHTDSIFCVVGERFGLVGAAIVLSLFAVLITTCLSTAARCEDPFGQLLAVGVAALFAAEVLINTGMLVGLLPITGVSLPLVSYGGSGLLAHLFALGLVVAVARSTS
jgi:cell division protein FtsW (lipid II flippase)